MLPVASWQLLYSITWQVGSETECLRVSLPRGPSVSSQLPIVYQKSQRLLIRQTCHTSARLEREEIRLPTHFIWGAVYTHRGTELVICKSTWFSHPHLAFPTEIMAIILCYDHAPAWLIQWKGHWIQSEATPTISTRDKSMSKQQLGSEVPTHQCLAFGFWECPPCLLILPMRGKVLRTKNTAIHLQICISCLLTGTGREVS